MKTIDPKERLEGGWTPSDIPDLRPDAPSVDPPKLQVLPPDAPSLCEQGPCIHYHEVCYELDAQKPLDQSEASSKSHRVRTCYASSGIEMPLDAPVFSCNFWDPGDDNEKLMREQRRDGHMRSEAGLAYKAELEAWIADQARIRAEEEDIAAVDLTELDTIGELRATMDDDDVLEIRLKGQVDLLLTLPIASRGSALQATCTDEEVGRMYGPAEYQVRHIRNKRIIAIKNFTIEPSEPQEPSE